jgi:hypothetical protein
MTNEQFKKFKISANNARTKYDMCYHMDIFNWRNIPWVNLMLGSLSKSSIRAEYEVFLFEINNL